MTKRTLHFEWEYDEYEGMWSTCDGDVVLSLDEGRLSLLGLFFPGTLRLIAWDADRLIRNNDLERLNAKIDVEFGDDE
jgi:hypothetical protein